MKCFIYAVLGTAFLFIASVFTVVKINLSYTKQPEISNKILSQTNVPKEELKRKTLVILQKGSLENSHNLLIFQEYARYIGIRPSENKEAISSLLDPLVFNIKSPIKRFQTASALLDSLSFDAQRQHMTEAIKIVQQYKTPQEDLGIFQNSLHFIATKIISHPVEYALIDLLVSSPFMDKNTKKLATLASALSYAYDIALRGDFNLNKEIMNDLKAYAALDQKSADLIYTGLTNNLTLEGEPLKETALYILKSTNPQVARFIPRFLRNKKMSSTEKVSLQKKSAL